MHASLHLRLLLKANNAQVCRPHLKLSHNLLWRRCEEQYMTLVILIANEKRQPTFALKSSTFVQLSELALRFSCKTYLGQMSRLAFDCLDLDRRKLQVRLHTSLSFLIFNGTHRALFRSATSITNTKSWSHGWNLVFCYRRVSQTFETLINDQFCRDTYDKERIYFEWRYELWNM